MMNWKQILRFAKKIERKTRVVYFEFTKASLENKPETQLLYDFHVKDNVVIFIVFFQLIYSNGW